MRQATHICLALIILIAVEAWVPLFADQATLETKWTQAANLLSGRTCQTATLLPNGQVLVTGGYGSNGYLSDAELYDPQNNSFKKTADLGASRAGHTATLLKNGQVLVVGGQSNGKALPSAELYNPTTGTWLQTSSLHIARTYHTATLLQDGQVLIVGGSRTASPPVFFRGVPAGSALDVAELYDPVSGKWTVTNNFHVARYEHAATLLNNGQVLITGGIGDKGGNDSLSSAELYNPSTKDWILTGSFHDARSIHTSTLLPNGCVLITGGQLGTKDLASTELYDPVKQTWTATGNLHTARNAHTATLLSIGQVLVAGGGIDPGITSSAEVYNPSKSTWEEIGHMSTARSLQTATLLPGGQLLIAGGSDGNGSPEGVLASTELCDISTKGPEESASPAVLAETPHFSSNPAVPSPSSLLTLASCLVIFTVCMVILTGCVVVLLAGWLVFVLIRHWRK